MLHLKDKTKQFIIRHSFIERPLFELAKFLSKGKAEKESERRKHISILDYEALAQEIPFAPTERVIDNNLYGYAYHLKKFAGITKDLKGYLEHGLFWGGTVHNDQKNWHFKRIITLSEMRRNEIKKQLPQKKVVTVGPYIHYAQDLMTSKERSKLKEELGKVLLAFPVHSMKSVKNNYDKQAFIDELNQIKSSYDTVLISLYYIDIHFPERVQPYLDAGFKIVTSGHRYDVNFVSRQKEIIQLADMTFSNSVGTHTGYCIYLNKPHYIFKQDYHKTAKKSKEVKRVEDVIGKRNNVMNQQKEELFGLFTAFSTVPPNENQKRIVGKYWGFDDVKTPQELRELLK